jgi:hypothetical protein
MFYLTELQGFWYSDQLASVHFHVPYKYNVLIVRKNKIYTRKQHEGRRQEEMENRSQTSSEGRVISRKTKDNSAMEWKQSKASKTREKLAKQSKKDKSETQL